VRANPGREPHLTEIPRRKAQDPFAGIALHDLDARLLTANDPDRIPVVFDPAMLSTAKSCTLTTPHGDLDVIFVPAGTQGYADLARSAEKFELAGNVVAVTALEDVVRMKRASGRAMDLALPPLLRQALEESNERSA
jgi:hypothetical protein